VIGVWFIILERLPVSCPPPEGFELPELDFVAFAAAPFSPLLASDAKKAIFISKNYLPIPKPNPLPLDFPELVE
jgi:hypothetical protein